MVLVEVGTFFAQQKPVSQVLDLPPAAGDSVDTDLHQFPSVDLIDAVDNNGRDHGSGVRAIVLPWTGRTWRASWSQTQWGVLWASYLGLVGVLAILSMIVTGR